MTSRGGTRRYLPNSPFKPPAPVHVETYEVDDRVSHDSYGLGRVVAVESDGSVLADFGSSRVRLTSPFNKLYKI